MSAKENIKLAGFPHVLVVDDDDRIRALVLRFLKENGFVPVTARDAAQAQDILKHFEFDVLVVDIMMPGQNGLDFTRSLRQAGNNIPVLLLTALGEAEDRIAGLETGADDYLSKPFEPRELVLRLQSLLRRGERRTIKKDAGFIVGPWRYDPQQNELQGEREAVRLTESEGVLLRALADRRGESVDREELAKICGVQETSARAIDVQVTRLRRKLEGDTKAPRWLQTVRGKGYRLLVGD